MNIIWFLLIAVSVVFSVVNGRLDDFTKAMFDASKSAVEVSLYLLGIVSLWMGLTKIIEDSGLIHSFSNAFRPAISRLFKNVPKDHPSITTITLNMLANLLGLGNAATPLGIKAMKDLQTLNPDKENITFEMMLFIVINTSSLQLIPFTVIGLLSQYGSRNPTAIVLPTIIATVVSTASAIGILYAFQEVLQMNTINFISQLIIPLFILFIAVYGLVKKVSLYNSFVSGAKDGIDVIIKIFPYILAIFLAIKCFQSSGAYDFVKNGFSVLSPIFNIPAEVFSVAVIKPLSGSASLGIFTDIVKTTGPDSLASITSAVIIGSAETTFYVLAVYLGAVGIKKTGYLVPVCITADVIGMIVAIAVVKLMF